MICSIIPLKCGVKEEPRNFLERGRKGRGTWASAAGKVEVRCVRAEAALQVCRLGRRGLWGYRSPAPARTPLSGSLFSNVSAAYQLCHSPAK